MCSGPTWVVLSGWPSRIEVAAASTFSQIGAIKAQPRIAFRRGVAHDLLAG
jgi:hypothetical protein